MQTVIFVIIGIISYIKRSSEFFMIPHFFRLCLYFVTKWNGMKIAKGYSILCFYPSFCFRALIILKPAIGIYYLFTKISVFNILFLGLRISELLPGFLSFFFFLGIVIASRKDKQATQRNKKTSHRYNN